ncbi:MAG: extracellular solute-binding protein, partial [Oscillospiraceae bacterium]|nr:extracellular solute-binding protein [Oscillospiraceae bacterium]
YFNDSSVLCAVDLKSGSVVEILNWINSDIDSNSMYNFVVINADKVICSGYDYNYDKSEMLVLTRIPDDQIVEKYLLTLACVYLDWEIRTAIIKFNRNSDEYRIQIHDYSQYNTNDDKGWENGINKLNMDLISGNIPDLIMLDSRMPLDSYAAKGIFMDLYKYMDSDPNFRREDYFTNVFKAMEYNGKLFRLTPGFNIQTVVAKTSLVGNKTGWTIDEFNALMNSLPPMALAFEDATQSGMLNKYCSMMIDEFIDKDTGRCYFDSEGFIKVLEYVKTLDTKGFWETINWEDIDDSFWQDRETAYRDNRTVLIDYWFDNFDQYWRTMKGQFGEDITFIGMPTESRNGSAIYSFVELAMSARTKSPDGAWQFLSYFLSDEYQNSRGWGIPMKISRFEQMAKEAMEPDWGELYPEDGYDTPGITVPKPMPARPVVTTEVAVEEVDLDGDGIIDSPSAPAPAYYWEPTYWIGNQEIKIGWITQEYVDRVMDFVKSVDRIVRNDQTMMEIINEEAGAFFAGQKSARETANIIQNRIQNYVSERR